MTPEEYMAFLESTHQMNEAITHIRDDLIVKGWTTPGAESASITVFGIAMQGALVAAEHDRQNEQRKGRK